MGYGVGGSGDKGEESVPTVTTLKREENRNRYGRHKVDLRLDLETGVDWKFKEAWRLGVLGKISMVSFSQSPGLKIFE